jgi:hypothetical protein
VRLGKPNKQRKNAAIKSLLTLTVVIEMGAGLALLIWPSLTVTFLLGSSLDTAAALTLGRVAGAALLALGVACWLARHDGQSRAATGLIAAILLYNLSAVSILASAGISSGLAGVALWPAVFLHAAMAAWCIVCLIIRWVM